MQEGVSNKEITEKLNQHHIGRDIILPYFTDF